MIVLDETDRVILDYFNSALTKGSVCSSAFVYVNRGVAVSDTHSMKTLTTRKNVVASDMLDSAYTSTTIADGDTHYGGVYIEDFGEEYRWIRLVSGTTTVDRIVNRVTGERYNKESIVHNIGKGISGHLNVYATAIDIALFTYGLDHSDEFMVVADTGHVSFVMYDEIAASIPTSDLLCDMSTLSVSYNDVSGVEYEPLTNCPMQNSIDAVGLVSGTVAKGSIEEIRQVIQSYLRCVDYTVYDVRCFNKYGSVYVFLNTNTPNGIVSWEVCQPNLATKVWHLKTFVQTRRFVFRGKELQDIYRIKPLSRLVDVITLKSTNRVSCDVATAIVAMIPLMWWSDSGRGIEYKKTSHGGIVNVYSQFEYESLNEHVVVSDYHRLFRLASFSCDTKCDHDTYYDLVSNEYSCKSVSLGESFVVTSSVALSVVMKDIVGRYDVDVLRVERLQDSLVVTLNEHRYVVTGDTLMRVVCNSKGDENLNTIELSDIPTNQDVSDILYCNNIGLQVF